MPEIHINCTIVSCCVIGVTQGITGINCHFSGFQDHNPNPTSIPRHMPHPTQCFISDIFLRY